jgi:hypothetical protein
MVAEMASAFACAALGIVPTVRHADYRRWLEVLRADEKAIFRAASAASKAADFLLAWGGPAMSQPLPPEWGTPVLPTLSPRAFWRQGQRDLRRMTKRQRAIFGAVRFEGASYAELAQRHGISVEAGAGRAGQGPLHADPCGLWTLVAALVAVVKNSGRPMACHRAAPCAGPSGEVVDGIEHGVLQPLVERAAAPAHAARGNARLLGKGPVLDLAIERRARARFP